MSKVVVFATVDRPGKVPMRETVITYQRKLQVVGDTRIEEETDYVVPNQAGVYFWRDDHQYHEARMEAMKAKMKRDNRDGKPPSLIGPFTDDSESGAFKQAMAAVQEVRPKTPEEEATVLKVKLSASEKDRQAERQALEAEIAELKKKLDQRQK